MPEVPDRARAESVVAVVVAHNRRDLLAQTLDGLAAQERPCDGVVVVDNASTDGSELLARAHELRPEVLALPRNTGGAGGFAVGIAHVLRGYDVDLLWLMDDDTVPTQGALAALLRARAAYRGRPALLASRSVWKDGREHPMNRPRERLGVSSALRAKAGEVGAIHVRSASFVSALLDAGAVRATGLPVADYFIWNDDFEYTARVLRRRVGLYVPASVVRHLTRSFGDTSADPGDRFYYEVRNKIWLFARSPAFGLVEKAAYGTATLRRWARTLAGSPDPFPLLMLALRGVLHALVRSPRPTPVVLSEMGAISAEVVAVERGAGSV